MTPNFCSLIKILFLLYSLAEFGREPVRAGLTISDLVGRANPPNDAVGELWLHRARYWSAHGILPTLGRAHKGTGRHRRFDEETAFLAAVLFRLSPRPISAISAIAQVIRRELNDPTESPFKLAWAAAKRGQDQHLAIYYTDPEVEHGPVFLYIETLGEKVETKVPMPIEVSLLNIGAIFRAMRREEG